MAAESLTRRAFPHHPQLWRVWSREAGATVQVAGRTVGGYLFVPLELALISAFYFVTNRWLGWWQPSESLTDPNVLSSFVPALAPIALSLQAGFMEECAFRAIPLALAALLGTHFGQRAHWIGFAVVLQAVVFAGAHANYPGLPAYSRLVELLLPATLWALIYPSLRPAADDPAACALRPVAVLDPAVPGRRAGRMGAARAGDRGRGRPACGHRHPARAVRRVERAPRRVVERRMAAIGRRGAPRRRADSRRNGRHARRRAAARAARAGRGRLAAWLACTPFSADVPALTVESRGRRSHGRRGAWRKGRRAWHGMATLLRHPRRQRRVGPEPRATLCLARGRCGRLSRSRRQHAGAADVGRALCPLRRRRRGTDRGMARHRDRQWPGPAGAAPAARRRRRAPTSRAMRRWTSRSGSCATSSGWTPPSCNCVPPT